MSKSIWKNNFINQRLNSYLLTQLFKENKIEEFSTRSRSSIITEPMVGKKFNVYNGKEYKVLVITEEMIGYKLGEFSFTRKVCTGKKDKKKKGDFRGKGKSK